LRLVVGLGNPGPLYRETLHNAGHQVVQHLIGPGFRSLGRGLFLGTIRGRRVALLQPGCFMNLSGPPVARCLVELGLAPQDLLLVHDDLDLPLGRLRFKRRGGSGGHRGVESVIAALGTEDFLRLKLGIGRPPPDVDPADYVLGRPGPVLEPVYREMLIRAAAAVATFLAEGLDAAMQAFHVREEDR
jgi:PTH1 family peptidyl-tRNA hydrolase